MFCIPLPPVFFYKKFSFRFRRTASQINWDTGGNNAHDAIAFKVDQEGVILHGCGVYLNNLPATILAGDNKKRAVSQFDYEMELYVNEGDSINEGWNVMEQSSGFVNAANVEIDNQPNQPVSNVEQENLLQQQNQGDPAYATGTSIALIRLQKPVRIRPDLNYAIRIHLNGGKTYYGEGKVLFIVLKIKKLLYGIQLYNF